MPQPPRLGFVAGFAPAAGPVLPALRAFDQPFETVGVAAHHHQRVAQVDLVIRPKAKLTARFQLGGEQVHRPVIIIRRLACRALGQGSG